MVTIGSSDSTRKIRAAWRCGSSIPACALGRPSRASTTCKPPAEKEGIWRNRGSAPQKLTGVGFIADGFETSAPYRKMPDAWHRTVSWITERVEGEIIGNQGLAYNAAAGVELDRYDLSLGTPPHTK